MTGWDAVVNNHSMQIYQRRRRRGSGQDLSTSSMWKITCQRLPADQAKGRRKAPLFITVGSIFMRRPDSRGRHPLSFGRRAAGFPAFLRGNLPRTRRHRDRTRSARRGSLPAVPLARACSKQRGREAHSGVRLELDDTGLSATVRRHGEQFLGLRSTRHRPAPLVMGGAMKPRIDETWLDRPSGAR
jgi:hypothetical protein